MSKLFIFQVRLPSLLQEQKAQALKRLRLQGAKRLGVEKSVDNFINFGISPVFYNKKIGESPILINRHIHRKIGKTPTFTSKNISLLLLIKTFKLSRDSYFIFNVNSSSSRLFLGKIPVFCCCWFSHFFYFKKTFVYFPRSSEHFAGAKCGDPRAITASSRDAKRSSTKFVLRKVNQ